MALMITDECISCGLCINDCPNEAITEGEPFFINPELCTECVGFFDEPQCVNACPVEAIVPDPDHQEDALQLLEKKKMIHGE